MGDRPYLILGAPDSPEQREFLGRRFEQAIGAGLLVLLVPFTLALVDDPWSHDLQLSASLGIVLYPGNGLDQHELLRNADAAMYHAKSAGKNGYSFFDASMNSNARQQLQLLQDLRTALEHNQFRLHYQPKFDAVQRQPIGAEALLRWEHPQHGLILPDRFIGLYQPTSPLAALLSEPLAVLTVQRIASAALPVEPYLKLAAVDGRRIA